MEIIKTSYENRQMMLKPISLGAVLVQFHILMIGGGVMVCYGLVNSMGQWSVVQSDSPLLLAKQPTGPANMGLNSTEVFKCGLIDHLPLT